MSTPKSTEAINIDTYFPVRQITDDVLISGDASITIGYEVEMPWIFTDGHEKINQIHEAWINLIKMFPNDTTIHKQEYIFVDDNKIEYTGKEGFCRKNNFDNFYERKILKHISKLFINFQKEGSTSTGKKSKYLLFERPYQFTAERKKEIEREIITIENSLRAIPDVKIKRLTNEDLGDALETYWNLSINDEKPLNYKDRVLQPATFEKENFKIAGNYVKILTLTTEGSKLYSATEPKKIKADIFGSGIKLNGFVELPVSMIYPISVGLPINHIVNTVIVKRSNDDIEKSLKSKNKEISALVAIKNPKAIQKDNEIRMFIESVLNEHNHQGCETAVNVILYDNDKSELEINVKHVKAAFLRMQSATCFEENMDTFRIFTQSSPGNAHRLEEKFINTADQAVCYLQKESMIRSMEKGFTFVDQFGKPFFLDLWDNPFTVVRHMCVFGMTRAGKSVTMNHFVNEMIDTGGQVIIIDVGGSYKNTVLLNNGMYLDTAKLEMNIFTLCGQNDEGEYKYKSFDAEEDSDFHMDFLIAFILLVWKGEAKVGQDTRQLLKDSIEFYYKKVNKQKNVVPTIKDYLESTKEFEKGLSELVQKKEYVDFTSLRLAMKDFSDGEYAKYFNAEKNIDISGNNPIAVDVKGVEGNKLLFQLVCLVVMRIAINKTEKLPRSVRKFLLIDEAVDFLKGDIGDFIAAAYRKMGKSGGAVAIATQDSTFLNSAKEEVRNSIIANTGILIVLGSGGKDKVIADLSLKFDLTENMQQMLQTMNKDPEMVKYREIFLKMGDKAIVPRVELSPKTLAVYSTTDKDMEKIEMLVKELGGNVSLAVKQFVEDKENKKI